MTFDKQTILNVIPLGRENAISRGKIKELTSYSDRHIRRCISEMVMDKDAAILSASKHNGYYLPQTRRDYTEAIADLCSKVETMDQRILALEAMRESCNVL